MRSCARWSAWLGRSDDLLEWKTASDSERGGDGSLAAHVPLDGFRSRARRRGIVVTRVLPSRGTALCGAFDRRVDCVAAGRLVAESADSQAGAAALRESAAISRKAVAQDVAILRRVRHGEDNWLPPDNIQQNPDLVVAPRTSPTNIGMALLADLAAYDFGYCSAAQLLVRTQHTFETLSRMERYRGHFFNWYDTRSLAPLHPRYVSTVDSGNLAANLLVLASGCAELSEAPVLPPRMFGGLRDTLRVLLDVARGTDVPLRRCRRAAQDRAPNRRSRPGSLGARRRQRLAVAAGGRRRGIDRRCGQRCRACVVGERLRAVLHRPSSRPAAPGRVARAACSPVQDLGARWW